ncbi:MAG: DUF2723 domain-containing protein [Chloroflexota bacterium]
MRTQEKVSYATQQFSLFFFLFIGGLASSRIGYELFFPRAIWLGNPIFVFPLIAILTMSVWAFVQNKVQTTAVYLSPLLLNFIYLSNPSVNLIQSRLIFGASIWLCFLLFAQEWLKKRPFRGLLFIWVALLPIYLLTTSTFVGRDDTFEFQVVVPQLGIVHPTGYPLYLLLGRLFSFLPLNSIAWRINFGSIVFAITAVSILYITLQKWWRQPLPAILTAVSIGVSATFWSQAIVAEVYALHALFICLVMMMLAKMMPWNQNENRAWSTERDVLVTAVLLGFGMTNHVTTVFLLPATFLTLYFAVKNGAKLNFLNPRFIAKGLASGLAPLILYAYLPLRWQAVNNEPMGTQRFFDWVVGGRFQDALQWQAWLNDPTRYEVVGRLFLENWGWFNLIVAAVGFGLLFYKEWKTAVVQFLIFLSYSFYCLNYYVPDLAVFLIPAQIVIGIWWGYAIKTGLAIPNWGLGINALKLGHGNGPSLKPFFLFIFLLPIINSAVNQWAHVTQFADDGRTRWGTAVLNQPLDQNAAILADSVKFPPLFYLQQSEGLRPDLDISVWPDEAAYRAQLDGRLAVGQSVYLARFLPGLESIYHLNSAGPLVHVSTAAQSNPPENMTPSTLQFEEVRLLGFLLEPIAESDAESTAVTLYWQANTAVTKVQHVFVRWRGFSATAGQHPANNSYPTVAWKGNEIVTDYHTLPYPILSKAERVALEVALGDPFSKEEDLDWQLLTAVELEPNVAFTPETDLRMVVDNTAVYGMTTSQTIRPLSDQAATFFGYGEQNFELSLLRNVPFTPVPGLEQPTISEVQTLSLKTIDSDVVNGRYQLVISAQNSAQCGWLRPRSANCAVGDIEVSGIPIPENAINFEDKIALIETNIDSFSLRPGGQLNLTFTWQQLSQMDEDYTVFIQVLAQDDQIVGQIDSWPLQGTLPTSQWENDSLINDPYTIQLAGDLHDGEYRVIVGFYLLETLRRLPKVDQNGVIIGNFHELSGFQVSQ